MRTLAKSHTCEKWSCKEGSDNVAKQEGDINDWEDGKDKEKGS